MHFTNRVRRWRVVRLSCSSPILVSLWERAAAVLEMRATNPSGVSTFLLQTSIYIQPQKQKSHGVRSGHSNISIPATMQD